MKPHVDSIEEAMELARQGKLQVNYGTADDPDGEGWRDLPQASLFGRRLQDYRERPTETTSFIVQYRSHGSKVWLQKTFKTPEEVSSFLWGRDVSETRVFVRWFLPSFDICKLEKQLEQDAKMLESRPRVF